MKILHTYLNPLKRLGNKNYSLIFPLLANIILSILSEIYAYRIAHDPMIVGVYIIFLNVFFILYFSFRDGIKGGILSSSITVLYYLYIIYTRHYHGQQLSAGIETTLMLAVLYILVSIIIGWSKQTIDTLIERESNEKIRLQTIIQQLPVGVITTDKHGKITQQNKQIEVILGSKFPSNFIFGKDIWPEFTHKRTQFDPSKFPLGIVLTTGTSINQQEYVLERKDKKQIHLQISATPIRSKKGDIIAAAEIINDITQQKELEKKKDDFVNMASHELKTPITSMKLYLDVLSKKLETYEDAHTKKIVLSIKKQTERLQKLVNDLIDVSRLQTGKLTFRYETFDINELITEMVEDLQATTQTITIHFTEENPYRVHADKFRIYQVLTNLITNAIKYSGKRKDIYITVKKYQSNITVCVQDFGTGIEKSQQRKVFDRLYQVADAEEQTFPGFGMGLYISKEIIARHKGNIWVESEKGKGSNFYFSLPIK